jgi:hypothetical protein
MAFFRGGESYASTGFSALIEEHGWPARLILHGISSAVCKSGFQIVVQVEGRAHPPKQLQVDQVCISAGAALLAQFVIGPVETNRSESVRAWQQAASILVLDVRVIMILRFDRLH